MKMRRIYQLAVLTSITSVSLVGVLSGHKAFASGNNQVSNGMPTHNALSNQTLAIMDKKGFVMKQHNGGNVQIPEEEAIQLAQQWATDFHGQGLNVQLVDFSKKGELGNFALASAEVISGDSHFVNGEMKDIPCWDVTIEGATLPGHYGSVTKDLHLIIDATNAKTLMAFSVSQNS